MWLDDHSVSAPRHQGLGTLEHRFDLLEAFPARLGYACPDEGKGDSAKRRVSEEEVRLTLAGYEAIEDGL